MTVLVTLAFLLAAAPSLQKEGKVRFFVTEDELAYPSESFREGRAPVTTHHGGGAAAGARTVLRWDELHKRLAESLRKFAESNYERIVSQRAPSR